MTASMLHRAEVCGPAGAIAFTVFNSAGASNEVGHAFGYCALALELLAYAGSAVYMPRISKRYGTVTLTALYYTVASVATAITLLVRERNQLGDVRSLCTAKPGCQYPVFQTANQINSLNAFLMCHMHVTSDSVLKLYCSW
jgi:hypothetical protein